MSFVFDSSAYNSDDEHRSNQQSVRNVSSISHQGGASAAQSTRARSRSPARAHLDQQHASGASGGRLSSIAAALSSMQTPHTSSSDPYSPPEMPYSNSNYAAQQPYTYTPQPVGYNQSQTQHQHQRHHRAGVPSPSPYASRYATAAPHATGVYNSAGAAYSASPQLSLPYRPPPGQQYPGSARAGAPLTPALKPTGASASHAAPAPGQGKGQQATYKFNSRSVDMHKMKARLPPKKRDTANPEAPMSAASLPVTDANPKRDPHTGAVFDYRGSFNRDIRSKGGNPNMFKLECKCVATGSQSGRKAMYLAQVLNTSKHDMVVGRTPEAVQGRANAANVAFFHALRNPEATRGLFRQEKEQRKTQASFGQHLLRFLAMRRVAVEHSDLTSAELHELMQGLFDERILSALHARMLELEPDNPYCRCDIAKGGLKRHATCLYAWAGRKYWELGENLDAVWDATALMWNRLPALLQPIHNRRNAARLREEEEAAKACLGGVREDADASSAPYHPPSVSASAAGGDQESGKPEADNDGWVRYDTDDSGADTELEETGGVPEVQG